jgi:hypothetical protein
VTSNDFDFIESCENFLNEKGYLTQKQVAALFAMDNNYRNNDYDFD